MVQGLRLHAPNAGGLGLISGQGTRSHMLQLRVHMLQQKLQPNKLKKENSLANAGDIKDLHIKVDINRPKDRSVGS